jgi:hypothetical protein
VPVSGSCDAGENSVNGQPGQLRRSAWTQPPTNTLRLSARARDREDGSGDIAEHWPTPLVSRGSSLVILSGAA